MFFAGFQMLRLAAVPRNADSAADRELTARLAERGLTGSTARYERWRHAGLLPRHERRGAGRGHGSVSVLSPATVEIAAALASHAAQGRDLRTAVVAWFYAAGSPAMPGEPAVLEPPDAAVSGALAWALRADPGYHMLQRARASVTEAQKDDFYAAAAALARRGSDVPVLDPSAVREALLTRTDLAVASSRPRIERVHLIAAMGLGAEEVGAEALADAISATGMFPQMSAQEWQETMLEAWSCGECAGLLAALTRFDLAKEVENAGIERLRQARETAIGLAGPAAMLILRALLMPDTPGLSALGARISELGMTPPLVNLARLVIQPQRIASAIANCLNPMYAALHRTLLESVAAGPPLLHQAGDDTHDPERYMASWIAAIRG
jgi:hypothetical protein